MKVDDYRNLVTGVGMLIEQAAAMQLEEDYAMFDGSELPPIDPTTVMVVHEEGGPCWLTFKMADGTRIRVDFQASLTD